MILALGVSEIFPPYIILPRTYFRGHFWNYAHEFSGDDDNPNEWIKEEYFYFIFVILFILLMWKLQNKDQQFFR